jgi:hypothetical protein
MKNAIEIIDEMMKEKTHGKRYPKEMSLKELIAQIDAEYEDNCETSIDTIVTNNQKAQIANTIDKAEKLFWNSEESTILFGQMVGTDNN